MAFNVFDRVQETTTTTGTGTVTLGGAVSGFQSFFNAGFNNGDTTYYCITNGTAWEVGLGTFTTGPNSLARTTILSSSNFNSAITLAGTSNVFCVYPASKAVYRDSSGNVAGYNLTAGTINSTTVGATSASTGAFTTLSASSTVSGTGFSTYLASPPAIGGTTPAAITGTTITANTQFSGPHNGTVGATTPNTGAFTTLSASSTVSGTGFSTYLASPPAIGGTTAAAGSFTTLSASSTLAAGGVPVSGYSLTVRSTALANAYFVDTDSGASGMNINFLKNSASPAASDDIANLRFYGNDSAAVQTEYVRLAATIADPTNGSEDGTLVLNTIKAGTVAERVRYSSADGLYVVDGAFRCPDAYASTTGTAANMVMSSASGILQRSTSSLRYKNSVENATYGLTEVMQLRPVTYKGNNDGDTVFGGFIAEEVHDIGLSQFVQYDEQNRPDALAYGNMVSLLTKAVQEQQAMIEDLKARIAVLEAR